MCLYQVSERTNARFAQRSDQGDGGDKVQLFENNALLANSNKTWKCLSLLEDLEMHISVICRNPHQQFCLDQQDLESNAGLPVLVFDCHGEKGNQYW